MPSSVLWDMLDLALAAVHKYSYRQGHQATKRTHVVGSRIRTSPPSFTEADAEIFQEKNKVSAYGLSPECLGVPSTY